MRTLADIFKRYRGPGHNMTVVQALSGSDATRIKAVRAKILMACVENQAQCFYDLWPETNDYPGAILIWREVAKRGYAPQALNRDMTALHAFYAVQEGE